MAWERPGFGKCRFCRAEARDARIKSKLAKIEEAGAEGGAAGGGRARAVDHKDVRTLQRLSTPQGKLFSRKRSGTCATHQRQIKRAVKRARFMALLPYVGR